MKFVKSVALLRCWVNTAFEMIGVRLMLWTGVVYAFLPDVLYSGSRIGTHHDEHYFLMHEEVARRTMVEFLQLPAWNPFFCGGIPELANPQSTLLAPDFVLRLLAGAVIGRKLTIVLTLIIGMEGVYRLGRRWRNSHLGSMLAAVVFSTSGWFVSFIELGWLNFFVGFQLLPWAVLFFSNALERGRTQNAIATAAVLTWMLFCGGTYTVPYTVLTLFLVTLQYSWLHWRAPRWPMNFLRPWCALAAVGLLSIGLGAIRLLPMANVIASHPRHWFAPERNNIAPLFAAMLDSSGGGLHSIFTGVLLLGLLATGVLWFDKLSRRYLIASAVFLLLALGNTGWWSPYNWLEQLPLFGQLRNPERFTTVMALFLALGAGRSITLFEQTVYGLGLRHKTTKGGLFVRTLLLLGTTVAVFGMCAYVVSGMISAHRVEYGEVYREPPLDTYRGGFSQTKGNRWDAHVWPLINRGSLACFEETPFTQSSALRADLLQEEFVLDNLTARLTRERWTPNRIDLRIDTPDPAIVIVNQNFHRAWTATAGHVFNHHGRIAVKLPPGTYRFSLAYRDWWIYVGAIISLLTFMCCVFICASSTRGSTRFCWPERRP
ncbi:MAG: hypothetical protein H6714_02840 [Myxococcales bacterium]|nr:hypothetical protein [Myxococcales bacterium]